MNDQASRELAYFQQGAFIALLEAELLRAKAKHRRMEPWGRPAHVLEAEAMRLEAMAAHCMDAATHPEAA